MTTENKTENKISVSKTIRDKEIAAIKSDISIIGKIYRQSIDDCADIYVHAVRAWHKSEGYADISLASLKACNGDLRPQLLDKTGMSLPVLNSTLSHWKTSYNDRYKKDALPVAETTGKKIKCAICGNMGVWKRELNGKTVCGKCFRIKTVGNETDSIDAKENSAPGTSAISFIATGNPELDCEKLQDVILHLVTDVGYKVDIARLMLALNRNPHIIAALSKVKTTQAA
jgi:hypothetical protein